MKNLKPVLLVEDDDVDALTVKRAFKDIKIANELIRVTDGEQAIDYLNNDANKKPIVILLDLNMPRMNGIEFLKVVKNDENLKKIPVVMLTTSKEDRDILESFKSGVAGFMVKPVDYKQFVETIRTIDIYWTLSEVPNGEQN